MEADPDLSQEDPDLSPIEQLAALFRTGVPRIRPCVGSGFCCKKSPCGYGERDKETGWCIHLVPWKDDTLDIPRYRCGRYEYIVKQPGADMMPAFGGGCCSPLFNDDRDRIVRVIRLRRGP